ncbi:hypothetical protein [Nesterenkonia sp.]|uniref:hypothetical protein n=1 Tax=Nesterenkonia sp. TaxID=704201 RepID=UPI00261D6B9D|nr:hypothetical protein [Nesterenkonia sp.]
MQSTASAMTGIYRPGYPFSGAELQVMRAEGLLRPMLADVYTEQQLPDTPQTRATAASALLNRTLRRCAVLCGETAAWVHLGRCAPAKITVITPGVYRRPTRQRWQIHQVPLAEGEAEACGPLPVTVPLRTAADLFRGIGTLTSQRSLDLMDADSRDEQLGYWPEAADPLRPDRSQICTAAETGQNPAEHRMQLIGELAHQAGFGAEELTEAVLAHRSAASRAEAVEQTAAQCVSRRLPTVR